MFPLLYSRIELQGPLHSAVVTNITLPPGCGTCPWELYWSDAGYSLMEVNEFATRLTGHTVKGDVCLVQHCSSLNNSTASSQQQVLDHLLQSRTLRMTLPNPRTCTTSPLELTTPDSQNAGDPLQAAGARSSSSCYCSHAALKRTRSLHHIAAANSTRQRILSGMNASPPDKTACRPSSSSSSSRHWESRCRLSKPPQQHRVVTAALAAADVGDALSDCSSSASSVSGCMPDQLQVPFSHLACSAAASRQQAAMVERTHPGCRPHPSSCSNQVPQPIQVRSHSSSRSFDQSGCTSEGHSSGPCGSNSSTAGNTCDCVDDDTQQQDVCSSSSSTIKSRSNVTPPAWGIQQQQSVLAPGSSNGVARWDDLSDDVIGRVAAFVGSKVSHVMPLYLTCRTWRRAVLENDQLLQGLSFSLNMAAPFKKDATYPAATVQQLNRCSAQRQHPALLVRATKLGNLSALVTRARCLDAAGLPDDAMRCWRRAAKAGDLEGQLLFGLALYKGTAGLAQDAEDAHMWLLRAIKQVVSGAAVHLFPAGEAALRVRVLTQCGLCLGYLMFDGEGVKADRQEAVKYFKLAAAAGCKEAQQVLGWVYNTGQY